MTPKKQDLMKQASEKISEIPGIENSPNKLISYKIYDPNGTRTYVWPRYTENTEWGCYKKANSNVWMLPSGHRKLDDTELLFALPYLKIEFGSKWDSESILVDLGLEVGTNCQKNLFCHIPLGKERDNTKWVELSKNPKAREIANMLAIHIFWKSNPENGKIVEDYFKELGK